MDQTGANVLSACRFCRTTVTGCVGHGNRSDSWNVRCAVLRFRGRFPFAVDRREAARVEQLTARDVSAPRRGTARGWSRSTSWVRLPGHGPSLTTRSSANVSPARAAGVEVVHPHASGRTSNGGALKTVPGGAPGSAGEAPAKPRVARARRAAGPS